MPQSRFMGPGEQPSTDTINEMLAAATPAAGPGLYVDNMPGRGLEIHLDEVTYDQGLGRHSFLARITRRGPEGERDLEGSNYWVREVRLVDRGAKPLRFISEKDEVEERFWTRAINLPEFRQQTPDDETHLLGLTPEQADDDGAIVQVKLYMEPDENGVVNHRPQWVFFGAIGGEGALAIEVKFKIHEDDYLVCRLWDGEKEGEEDILVMKRPLLWRRRYDWDLNDHKRRKGIKYIYPDVNTHWERTAFLGEGEEEQEEEQVIVPSYTAEDEGGGGIVGDDILFVTELRNPVRVVHKNEGVMVKLVHLGERAWAQKTEPEE